MWNAWGVKHSPSARTDAVRSAEQLFHFFEEALSFRMDVVTGRLRELLEMRLLLVVELARNFDAHLHQLIAAPLPAQERDAFPLQAEHRTGLRARRNLHRHF